MEISTIDLLNKYPNDITELDISKKQINGILDLTKYNNLTKLNCSKNYISQIINIPISLLELNCSNTKITNLDTQEILSLDNISGAHHKFTVSKFIGCNLPNNLVVLDCYCNQIKNLDNLPSSLTKLNCYGTKIENFNNLPHNLIDLDCRYIYYTLNLHKNKLENKLKIKYPKLNIQI